ncbi:response regulator transcription factor [Burkholderia ubonensis]|uniref:response regulator transcription factor n=1 Tax=Burkholderia ubonensis TaxID=101571 RepID=UPI000754468B|nr:response regulator transcription factor [Burkholderia ubonensis]
MADDHPMMLLGITSLLEAQADIDVRATAGTVAEMFDALARTPCRILIADYEFDSDAEPDGLRMIERLARHHAEVGIILYSMHDDLSLVKHAMSVGAAGFVSKAASMDTLTEAIRTVARGERYIDPATSKRLVQWAFDKRAQFGDVALSAREMEVVRLFSTGLNVSEIAAITNRSVKTISAQKLTAMKKLGVKSDVELVEAFRRLH